LSRANCVPGRGRFYFRLRISFSPQLSPTSTTVPFCPFFRLLFKFRETGIPVYAVEQPSQVLLILFAPRPFLKMFHLLLPAFFCFLIDLPMASLFCFCDDPTIPFCLFNRSGVETAAFNRAPCFFGPPSLPPVSVGQSLIWATVSTQHTPRLTCLVSWFKNFNPDLPVRCFLHLFCGPFFFLPDALLLAISRPSLFPAFT